MESRDKSGKYHQYAAKHQHIFNRSLPLCLLKQLLYRFYPAHTLLLFVLKAGSFRRDEPFFYGFNYCFSPAADAQFMKSTV